MFSADEVHERYSLLEHYEDFSPHDMFLAIPRLSVPLILKAQQEITALQQREL